MAKTTHRLTAVAVRGIARAGLHPDGAGLYLKVASGGAKSWVYRFMLSGRPRYLGLGSAGVVGLGKARELAGSARTLVTQGIDPIDHRKDERAKQKLNGARGMTFRQAAEALIAAHEPAWRNAKHRQQWRNTLVTYVYPVLGDVPVGDVDTELVLRVLEPIWAVKSETASRVRGRIEAVIDWAKARGAAVGENPARWRGHLDKLLPKKSKVSRVEHHAALPYTQVPALMAELRARTSISARALELLILTALRTEECLGACFDEFDLDAKIWTVPEERMKGGREHRVPLSPRAVTILKEMNEVRLNEYVFPGMKQGRPLSNMALLMMLRDLRAGYTVHGFRSSFKDWCAETTTFPDHVSEAALAHVSADRVRAAYARSDLFEKRRKLMQAWASYCGRKTVVESIASS